MTTQSLEFCLKSLCAVYTIQWLENYLKNYPKAGDECNLWLDLISRFAANMNLMEVEEVVNFQNSLESANPNEKASIKEAIGKALQKRQGN